MSLRAELGARANAAGMIDRHGLVVAARAGAATLVAGATAYAIEPGLGTVCAIAGAAGVIAFELSRVSKTLVHRLRFLDADLAQTEPLIALYDHLGARRPLPALRGYAISPDFALVLMQLVDDLRPELVVETGSGVSTLVIAYRLERLGRGRVVALDHDPVHAARTRAELARHGLSAYAQVVDAPLAPVTVGNDEVRWHATAALAGLDGIDLVLDDGPPRELGAWLRYASLPLLAPRLSARGVFVMNMLGAEEHSVLARWHAELPAFHQEVFATKKGHAILARHTQVKNQRLASK